MATECGFRKAANMCIDRSGRTGGALPPTLMMTLHPHVVKYMFLSVTESLASEISFTTHYARLNNRIMNPITQANPTLSLAGEQIRHEHLWPQRNPRIWSRGT